MKCDDCGGKNAEYKCVFCGNKYCYLCASALNYNCECKTSIQMISDLYKPYNSEPETNEKKES